MEYFRNNTKRQVYARKEVILATGAIGSPHLLMVSGVGPKDHLEKLKVMSQVILTLTSNSKSLVHVDSLVYF